MSSRQSFLVIAAAIIVLAVIVLTRGPTHESTRPVDADQRESAQVSAAASSAAKAVSPGKDDNLQETENSILDGCKPFRTADENLDQLYSWEAAPLDKDAAAEFLAASPDRDQLIAAALLTLGGHQVELRVSRYEAALMSSPKRPDLLHLIYSECARQEFVDWCAAEEIEERMISADPGNGVTWAMIASRRIEQGHLEKALSAFQRAATSPVLDGYFSERFGIVYRGLVASGQGNGSARLLEAIAHIRSAPYGIMLVDACGTYSPDDPQWYTACLAYGTRIEKDAGTELEQSLGLNLQMATLNEFSDSVQIEAMEERIARGEAIANTRGDHPYLKAEFHSGFFADESNVEAFATEWINNGGLAARDYLGPIRRAWLFERCRAAVQPAAFE